MQNIFRQEKDLSSINFEFIVFDQLFLGWFNFHPIRTKNVDFLRRFLSFGDQLPIGISGEFGKSNCGFPKIKTRGVRIRSFKDIINQMVQKLRSLTLLGDSLPIDSERHLGKCRTDTVHTRVHPNGSLVGLQKIASFSWCLFPLQTLSEIRMCLRSVSNRCITKTFKQALSES
ncbi:hypothetical protein ES703_66487 [subsurface metagenome]